MAIKTGGERERERERVPQHTASQPCAKLSTFLATHMTVLKKILLIVGHRLTVYRRFKLNLLYNTNTGITS